jgi:hypothetical protein
MVLGLMIYLLSFAYKNSVRLAKKSFRAQPAFLSAPYSSLKFDYRLFNDDLFGIEA